MGVHQGEVIRLPGFLGWVSVCWSLFMASCHLVEGLLCMRYWMDGWMAGWLAGWLAGWMDGWMDGRMDGWMDG